MQNVKAGFGILRYGVITGCVIFTLILFFSWHTPVSLFIWHHMHDAESAALATWVSAASAVVMAFATTLLLRGLLLTKESIDDARRSAEEAKRTALLQLMCERFNGPNFHFARAVFAKTHLDRKRDGALGKIKDRYVPSQGWQIIYFLNEIGHLVQTERLDFEEVELAFATHIRVIGGLWKEQFDQEFRDSRCKPFLDLYDRAMASRLPNAFESELDLFFDEAFWESEAALSQLALSEERPSLVGGTDSGN
jgi:hypothetical protein